MRLTGLIGIQVAALCIASVLVGCASTGDDSRVSLYASKSALLGDVYYARAPSMQTAERELAECLFRVAGQVSLRKKVFVRYIVSPETTPDGSAVKRTQVVLDYDQSNSIAILDKLTVIKVARTATGTEALVKYASAGNRARVQPDARLDASGNPRWVTTPPRGSGFFAAVGSIVQNPSAADGYANADTNAIGALASLAIKPVESGNSRVYEGTLRGVYIARRWFNAREGRWYSLAILPR